MQQYVDYELVPWAMSEYVVAVVSVGPLIEYVVAYVSVRLTGCIGC